MSDVWVKLTREELTALLASTDEMNLNDFFSGMEKFAAALSGEPGEEADPLHRENERLRRWLHVIAQYTEVRGDWRHHKKRSRVAGVIYRMARSALSESAEPHPQHRQAA